MLVYGECECFVMQMLYVCVNILYVGFAVLELSKLLMYQFHYDHILPTYGQGAKLLFTDTGMCGIIL